MITLWPSLYKPGKSIEREPASLLRRVERPRTYETKEQIGRWAGAVYRDGYRDTAHWLSSSFVVLDLDQGATLAQVEAAFGDWTGFAHTTWSSAPDVERWRVAGQLDREVDDRDEMDRVWRAAADVAERAGLVPDYAARDVARCWALPGVRPGGHYRHVILRGALFDVADALERFPEEEPLPEPERIPHVGSYGARLDRARRYLARMPGAISGSGGHRATFAAALAMVRGFALEPDDALRLLLEVHNPLCEPAWSRRELEHKVRQAVQRGRIAPGWLADRPRDGRAA